MLGEGAQVGGVSWWAELYRTALRAVIGEASWGPRGWALPRGWDKGTVLTALAPQAAGGVACVLRAV